MLQKPGKCVGQTLPLIMTFLASQLRKSMFVENVDIKVLMHTGQFLHASRIPRTYGVSTRCFCMHVRVYDKHLRVSKTLGLVRPIATWAPSLGGAESLSVPLAAEAFGVPVHCAWRTS